MKTHKLKSALMLSLIVGTTSVGLLSTGTQAHVYADDKKDSLESKQAEATVLPILPEGQREGVGSYFSINWKEGGTETLGVSITNNTDKEKSYELVANKAVTNPNGIVVYDDDQGNSIGVEPRVNEFLKVPKEVKVPPHKVQEVKVNFTMGNEPLNGYKLGGIVVTEKKEEGKSTFTQRLAYAFPLVIKGDGAQPKAEVNFKKFKFKKVGSGLYSVETPFENKEANWHNKGKSTITLKNSKGETIISEKDKALDIAPESEVDLQTKFNKDIPAGTYTLTAEINSEYGKWSDTQKVELSKDEAKKLSETVNIGDRKKTPWYENYILDALIVLIALIVGYGTTKLIKNRSSKKSEK